MKIYYIITDSMKELEENYFLLTAKKNLSNATFHPIRYKAKNENIGNFWDEDYLDTLIFRSKTVINLIEENWGDYFILSDVDIVIVRDFYNWVEINIKDKDILHQRDGSYSSKYINGGFTVIKCNEKSKKFYEWILEKTISSANPKYLDQSAMYDYYYKYNNLYELDWDYLPWDYFATRYEWENFKQNKDKLFLFHANVTMPQKNWSSLDQKKYYLEKFLLWQQNKIDKVY